MSAVSGSSARESDLVARGLIRLKSTTTSDLDRVTTFEVPEDVSPLEVLLAQRAEDER